MLLLCGASQQKLSFVLTGGVVGLWASYKILGRHPFALLLAGLLMLAFFAPRAWWNWQQVSEPGMLTLLTPFPDSFTQNLKDFREQQLWFPFNLVVPESVSFVSATIGMQVFLAGLLRFQAGPWRQMLILTFSGALLTYVFGQSVARSFYEFILWIAVGLCLCSFQVVRERTTIKAIGFQGIGVMIMAIIGIYTLSPGVLSLKLREQVMLRTAHQYQAIKWVNEILPEGAVVATDLRSVALLKHDFIALKGSNIKKKWGLNIKKRATHLLSKNPVHQNTILLHKNTFTTATRNPMNSGKLFKTYLYKIKND